MPFYYAARNELDGSRSAWLSVWEGASMGGTALVERMRVVGWDGCDHPVKICSLCPKQGFQETETSGLTLRG